MRIQADKAERQLPLQFIRDTYHRAFSNIGVFGKNLFQLAG